MGWTDPYRIAGIMGDTLGRGGVYGLLPDETPANVSGGIYGTYETCRFRSLPTGMSNSHGPCGTRWCGYGTT